jgi:hypothetical protein
MGGCALIFMHNSEEMPNVKLIIEQWREQPVARLGERE